MIEELDRLPGIFAYYQVRFAKHPDGPERYVLKVPDRGRYQKKFAACFGQF
jgi:hypothetical protein